MPALKGVSKSMSEVEYHALSPVKLVVFNYLTLDIHAGVNHFVHYFINIVKVMGLHELKKLPVPYHAVLYALAHTFGKHLGRESFQDITVADYKCRLLESAH